MSFAELSESLNWFFPRTKQCLDINPCVILSFLSRFLLLRNDDTSWKERKDKKNEKPNGREEKEEHRD